MKFGTSFFNPTVLKKDITRFAPAWALYLVGALLVMLGFSSTETDSKLLAQNLNTLIGLLAVVNLAYALLNAQLLFGDLFHARLCNALHALPLRREGWFLTHVISGLLFSLVPNVIVGLCLMPRLDAYWPMAAAWIGGLTMSYLFFFGAAVLSAMCTGNRFAMTLVYGLLNFLSIIVLWVAKFLYEPQMFGIDMDSAPFQFLCPVWYLTSREMWYTPESWKVPNQFGAASGLPYLWGIALIGAALLVLALLLYRRRKLESAGDFVTVKPLAPVFAVLYTLTAGIVLHLFREAFGLTDSLVFLAVGITVGYLTGQMLLKRTVKVFTLRTFAGLGMVAVVLIGSLWLTRLDVCGIVRYLPAPEAVQTVTIGTYSQKSGYQTSDPSEIANLVGIHSDILSGKTADKGSSNFCLDLKYVLKDGRQVQRSYDFFLTDDLVSQLSTYLSRPEYVMEYTDWEEFRENIISVSFCYDDNNTFYGKDAREVLDAIKADCEAGIMAQDWALHNDGDVMPVELAVQKNNVDEYRFRSVTIWENCVNTLTWMEEHGVDYRLNNEKLG